MEYIYYFRSHAEKRKEEEERLLMWIIYKCHKNDQKEKIATFGVSKPFGLSRTTLRSHLKHCKETGNIVSKLL